MSLTDDDNELFKSISWRSTLHKISALCSAGYCLLVFIYFCTTNVTICKTINTWIESMLTACCKTFLGTPRGIFDNQDVLEDHNLKIYGQKLSTLSLITLVSYVVCTFLVICETSLRVYISIDEYLECKDNHTCVVTNKLTKGHEIRHKCSAIEEDKNIIFHSCYKVSYKQNEALASAGGFLTLAQLIPQIIRVIISMCNKVFSFLHKLSKKPSSASSASYYYYYFLFLQIVFNLFMLSINFVFMPLFSIRMYRFPTSVEHSIDQLIIHYDGKVWITMGLFSIGTVMVNTIYKQEAAKHGDDAMETENDTT